VPVADRSALAAGLEERVARLWWRISRSAPSDLSRTAGATLARLSESGPHRVGELAAAESVSQPTMSCVLQRLERDGLVTRRSDPADARAARLSITAAGRQALQAHAARRAEALADELERLDPADCEILERALAAIDAVLHEADTDAEEVAR